jgi:hypothetical protein
VGTVKQRVKETDLKERYWNRKVQEFAITLEEFAKDYHAAGQPEKAVQVFMVLLKHTKKLCSLEGQAELITRPSIPRTKPGSRQWAKKNSGDSPNEPST